MRFGDRVRDLRKLRGLTQQKLAERLSVSLSYISKVENARLNVGDYPSESFVLKLAEAVDADADELLLLTDRVPEAMLRRIQERPEAFQLLSRVPDQALDEIITKLKPTEADREQ